MSDKPDRPLRKTKNHPLDAKFPLWSGGVIDWYNFNAAMIIAMAINWAAFIFAFSFVRRSGGGGDVGLLETSPDPAFYFASAATAIACCVTAALLRHPQIHVRWTGRALASGIPLGLMLLLLFRILQAG